MDSRLSLVAAIGAILLPVTVVASGWSNWNVIDKVYVFSSRTNFVHTSGTNPDSCGAATDYILQTTHANYATLHATALSAYLAGKQVRFSLNGCVSIGGTTYPIIDAIQVD
jgi:hypothetical protein